ncbi:DUF4362 domain-containing protein [Paenibacillus sp. sgz302251]|uniref:DUF4362 domain-containing protein n=1 Tax=Paenibacillus sp. sgz302251 TaxID=3414493 RepID=UPI003C7A2DD9
MREKWGLGNCLMILFGMAALLLGLVGCGEEPTAISTSPPAATSGELVYKETLLNEQDTVETLKANGVELTADPADSYFELNKVKPFNYALPGNEKIMVYVYDNAEGTRKARLDFADQTKMMDLNLPIFYDIKNVLILYQHNVSGDRPQERTAYHSKIESSIEQLLGDEIYITHVKTYNLAKLESFISNFTDHQADQLKITSLTIEGDPIYIYLLTNGTKLQYVYDNSEEAFAGSDKGVSKTECAKIEHQRTEEGHTLYVTTGCQNKGQRYILTVPEDAPEPTAEAVETEKVSLFPNDNSYYDNTEPLG